MEIGTILFPTDFTEGSKEALPFVEDLVKKYGAKLHILHVVYDIVKADGWYVPHMSTDEFYKELEAGAKKELERTGIEELRNYENVERTVIKGIPHEEIVKFSNEKGVDLIIMGTHGRRGIDRVFFGGTASKVVRKAPCPVLTVRIPEGK